MLTGPEKIARRIVFHFSKFWCDSDITLLHGLHKKIMTVLYFSIIIVFWLLNLCGVGGDARFAPHAYLVCSLVTFLTFTRPLESHMAGRAEFVWTTNSVKLS